MLSVALSRDVLAIRCFDNFVIVGIGNQLHTFNQSTLKLISIIEAFDGDCVHELIITPKKLIVFGGKHLSVFEFRVIDDTIVYKKVFSQSFHDWIIAAKFLANTEDVISLLFAHNNLYFFNILTEEFKNVWCEEKCILYGGCLSNENLDEVFIFSGTVFREILIWKASYKEDCSKDMPILHTLKGHKGVIFSVFYDPLRRLITSTSDDRTVKLWEVKDKSNGFDNLERAEIILKSTLMSHTARVWRSIIINDLVISIGEDSLLCIWSLDGKLCNKISEAHDGAVIWSIDVSENKSTIFTGGADGAVNSWPLLHTQATALKPALNFEKTFTPKYICYLTSGAYLVFMDGGRLVKYDETSSVLKDSIDLPRYQSYCVMQLCPNRTQLAFASKNGHVDIFQDVNKRFESFDVSEKVIESQIHALHWLNDQTLLICGDQGCLKMLKITKEKTIEVESEFILPANKECWTTAAILVKDSLICGDRSGSIFIYSTSSSDKDPKQTLNRLHGRLGVQSFEVFGEKLLSTGRDGAVRFYKISESSSDPLQVLHWKKMPMEWVSKTIKTDNDLYVLGFKEVEFMIYSTRLNRLILKIVCGGGHRSWDCIFLNNHINFACIRNKQIFKLENEPCSFSDTLIPGYHTKEILTLQVFPGSNQKYFISGSEDCTLRIGVLNKDSSTGYKFQPLDTFYGHISNVKSVALVNLNQNQGQSRNLVFSGGGRAQLKVWQVELDVIADEDVQDYLIVKELTSFMLRGTDKDRRKTWVDHNRQQPYFMDPETRFMDISIHSHPDKNNLFVFVACSDGFLRILVYNIEENTLNLTSAVPYLHRCIIKVCHFLHEDELILISMATDGIINFWALTSTVKEIVRNDCQYQNLNLQPIEKWSVHQSGINSYDLKKTIGDQYLLATGGDDNKVNLSMFTVSKSNVENVSIELIRSWASSDIHVAQITGMKFVDDNYLISAALDQKVVLYEYSWSDSNLTVVPVKTVSTFIADLQGMTVLNINNDDNDKLICIYGQGIEILKI